MVAFRENRALHYLAAATATAGTKGFWSYFIPVEFALAAGEVYEIIESIVAEIVTPEQGEAFVGMQGDIWDSQKDIALGGVGAVLMMAARRGSRRRRRGVASEPETDLPGGRFENIFDPVQELMVLRSDAN